MKLLLYSFFFGCLFYLLIVYAIRRVWLLNHPEKIAGLTEDIPSTIREKALLLFVREYFYLCLHLLLYFTDWLLTPFAFIIKKHPPSCEVDIQPPVILIHGYMMRGGVLWPMLWYLKRKGFQEVSLFTYKKPWKDIASSAEQLAEEIDKVLSQCKIKKVDLVAHSMGGLVARYYINFLGGDRKVGRLVTLGTPHNGTILWALSSFKSGVQMRPESRFLTYLAENDEKLALVPTWSIYSDFDELIIPADSPVLEGKNIVNRKIPDLGHTGLVYDIRTYQVIIEALKRKAV